MKKHSLQLLRILFGAGLIAYIAAHWNKTWNLSVLFEAITWQSVTIGTVLFLLFQFLIGLPWLWADLGNKAKPLSMMMMSVATNFYNLVLPGRSGVLVRALYLKKNFQFEFKSYMRFCGVLSWAGGIILVISLLIVLFSGVLTHDQKDLRDISIVLTIALLSIPVISNLFMKNKEKYVSYFGKPTFIAFASFALAQLVYIMRISYFYYLATGRLDLRSSALIAIIVLTSGIIQLLPGNIGVKEATFVFAGRLAGIDDPSLNLQVALMDRALSTFLLLALGIPWHLFFTIGNSKISINRKALNAVSEG